MKLIAIPGPTTSGKTALSLRLTKNFHGEIISADSRQVYKGMDIETAKATKKEQRLIRHHLIDIKKPNQSYTLAHFKRDANQTIQKITKRGKLPFLVGGTGHYVHALLTNLTIPQVPPNPALRKKLARLSAPKLYSILTKLDPARAKTIDAKNPRRLIRAIEIAKALGKVPPLPLPLFRKAKQGEKERGSTLVLGLQIPKPHLRRNINSRVDQMFRRGLVAEIKKLIKRYDRRKIFTQTIGYREVIDYLDEKITIQQAREQIKKNTWHYTKHQYNWLKRLPVVWIKS